MDESDDIKGLDPKDQEIWDSYMNEGEDIAISEENFEALLKGEEKFVDQGKEQRLAKKEILHTDKVVVPKVKQDSYQLDRRTEDKLKKGKMPIEARLDLHGLNKTQAHEQLVEFLNRCYQKNLRCVLVITGKGKSKSTSSEWLSPSKGVLKEKVPFWLSSNALNKIILKYFEAQPKDGGSGALYVYLRRQK